MFLNPTDAKTLLGNSSPLLDMQSISTVYSGNKSVTTWVDLAHYQHFTTVRISAEIWKYPRNAAKLKYCET